MHKVSTYVRLGPSRGNPAIDFEYDCPDNLTEFIEVYGRDGVYDMLRKALKVSKRLEKFRELQKKTG